MLGGCKASAAGDKAGRGAVYLSKHAKTEGVVTIGMEVVSQ